MKGDKIGLLRHENAPNTRIKANSRTALRTTKATAFILRKVRLKPIFYSILTLLLLGFVVNCIQIYHYSFEYSERASDAIIILGAGTSNGKVSPVFRERINHAIYLYQKGTAPKVIITGGYGKNQKVADSESAKGYAVRNGVSEADIVIEKKSAYTIENIAEAKELMDSLSLKTALLVSDPLHMKRSMALASEYGIDSSPSPTKTSMYRSFFPKAKFLLSESLYYSMGVLTGRH